MAAVSSKVVIMKIETRMGVEESGAAGAREERRNHATRTPPTVATSTSRHCAALRELRSS